MTSMRSGVRLFVLALMAALVVGVAAAAAPSPSFAPSVRLGFPHGDDWEPAIAADRSGHVYAAYSHYTGYAGAETGEPDPSCPACASPHTVLQVSSDGGKTWSSPRALAPSTTRQDDPQIVVDAADGRTVYAAFMQNNKSSQYVARSDDYGNTWRTMLVEPLQRGTDKDILAARGGHVYLVYHTQQKIFASVSHDGGKTWSITQSRRHDELRPGCVATERWRDRLEGERLFRLERCQQSRPGEGHEESLRHDVRPTAAPRGRHRSSTSRSRCLSCSCPGWDYWGSQMALGVDGKDRIYVLWNAAHTSSGKQRMYLALVLTTALPPGAPRARSRSRRPAPTISSPRSRPAATATCGSPGWTTATASIPEPTIRARAGTSTTARRRTAAQRGHAEAKLSQYVPGYPYKYATPKDGFAEPYGDYFELDIDGAGQTQAIWGEGPSYVGPGNVWYATGR